MIVAIDPGHVRSAVVWWDEAINVPCLKAITPNDKMVTMCEEIAREWGGAKVVIEMLACFGMPVGREVFETALWIGQFIHACGAVKPTLLYRMDVKMHFCKTSRAKDPHIRQALIDRFGQPGTKKCPGVLYEITRDMWSAVALAVFYADTHAHKGEG